MSRHRAATQPARPLHGAGALGNVQQVRRACSRCAGRAAGARACQVGAHGRRARVGLAGGRSRQLGERVCRRAGHRSAGRVAAGAVGARWACAAWAHGLSAWPGRAAWGRSLGARPGRAAWAGLCTWCTRPVFSPVRLGIFPESNFWTLFVNPTHEHCSSKKKFPKKKFIKLNKNKIKSIQIWQNFQKN